jgi:signal transduction histidine kinase/CheY-like chemotaxis protein
MALLAVSSAKAVGPRSARGSGSAALTYVGADPKTSRRMGAACRDTRSVWVVDDSPLDAERARRALSEYRVQVFSDGSAVLEHIGQQPPPDVLLLDWVMPGISGIEVCQFLRSEQGGHPRMAILLLTSQHQTDQIVAGLSAGANDFLSKPYAEPELQARVASLVRARRLLERAESAEARISAFLASSPDPLIGVDANGRVNYLGGASASLFGDSGDPRDSIEGLRGRPLSELLPAIRLADLVAAAAPGTVMNVPDVKIGEELYAPSVRFVADAEQGQTIIALRNVTERRRAEARRLDFYSVIAHDLRSPLNTVLLRTALIRKGKHGELPVGMAADIGKIEESVRSQMALINDFLELARLEGTVHTLERNVVDLVSVVDATIDELRPAVEAGALLVEVKLPAQPAEVVGDRRRLVQVLSNLIGNAVKYTPTGGRLSVELATLGDEVEVAVRDTGAGIPADALPSIFDRFTRAQQQHQVGGTGLGLMIVREVVESHGGTVGVESAVGEGSRFWFRLPRAARAQATI